MKRLPDMALSQVTSETNLEILWEVMDPQLLLIARNGKRNQTGVTRESSSPSQIVAGRSCIDLEAAFPCILYSWLYRNTQGTTNFQPRIHKFDIALTLAPNATVANPASSNLVFTYDDTILLFAPDGTTPCTGLDADGTGHISYPGFPDLPVATFSGDGFGNPGPVQKRIPIDAEGLALANGGSFWVSDEYGPYVYHFDTAGKMIGAIRPPDASEFYLF